MKRIISIIICLILLSTLELSAQPKSINYKKEHDFFLEVIHNPDFSLGEFLVVGINSSNCELKSFDVYNSNYKIRDYCRKNNININIAYYQIKSSWQVLLLIEDADWLDAMIPPTQRTIFHSKVDPELKHRVSIVPLKLEEY